MKMNIDDYINIDSDKYTSNEASSKIVEDLREFGAIYYKRFYDNDGFDVDVYQCKNCKKDIYVGERCELEYCTSCGCKIDLRI